MATPTVANIIKSGAVLWYAPVGEAVPDESTVEYGADWGGNWARVGYTKEALTVAYESEEAELSVEEELAPVARRRISEALTVETVLAELTATYLALATGDQDAVTETAAGASQKAYEETGLGGVSDIQAYAWGIEGRFIDSSDNDQPIRMFIHKGTAILNGELEFSQKSDDYVGIPIQIKALADPSQSAGQKLALFQRVTAPAMA